MKCCKWRINSCSPGFSFLTGTGNKNIPESKLMGYLLTLSEGRVLTQFALYVADHLIHALGMLELLTD